MYAVVRSGGKQYKVQEGDIIRVEKIDVEAGAEVKLDEVLLVVNGEKVTIGCPLVKGASVKATVSTQGRGAKLKIIKKRRRKHYRKQMGHRQAYTELTITGIRAK